MLQNKFNIDIIVYCDLNNKIEKSKKLQNFIKYNLWTQLNEDKWTKRNLNDNNSNIDLVLWKNNSQRSEKINCKSIFLEKLSDHKTFIIEI